MGNTIAESNVRTKIANASGSQAGTYKREKENDAINTAASNQGVVAERPLKGGETTANPNPTPQVVYLSSNPPTVQAPPTTYVELDNNGNIIASTDPGIIGDNINGNNNTNRPDHVGRRSHRRHNNSNTFAPNSGNRPNNSTQSSSNIINSPTENTIQNTSQTRGHRGRGFNRGPGQRSNRGNSEQNNIQNTSQTRGHRGQGSNRGNHRSDQGSNRGQNSNNNSNQINYNSTIGNQAAYYAP